MTNKIQNVSPVTTLSNTKNKSINVSSMGGAAISGASGGAIVGSVIAPMIATPVAPFIVGGAIIGAATYSYLIAKLTKD